MHNENKEEIPLMGGQQTQAYGWDNPIALVNDMEQDLYRALQNHQKAGRHKAAAIFQQEIDWFKVRAQALREVLSDQIFS